MPRKIFTATVLLMLLSCTASFPATNDEAVLARWSHENYFADKDAMQEIRLKATYYSNEYIEALIAAEAEKNLWTEDEAENYKYQLLKNLELEDAIAFRLELNVRGIPVYAGPFEKHITMRVGKNKYTPSGYDRRFNFKIQGNREGMVYFPRYDPKTGKDILNGAKEIRLEFDSSVSMAMSSRGNLLWVWDLTKDRGQIGGGRAANRLEIDRLLKRTDKLNADREALRKQLEALDKEYEDVNSRIDELQAE